jgi:hypothetical protein
MIDPTALQSTSVVQDQTREESWSDDTDTVPTWQSYRLVNSGLITRDSYSGETYFGPNCPPAFSLPMPTKLHRFMNCFDETSENCFQLHQYAIWS